MPPLPLPLPGLGIRTELKRVCLSLSGLNLAVFFHFSVFRPDDVVLENFGRKNLFWSNLAKESGFGQFWPEKLVFDWKNTKKTKKKDQKNDLRRFWTEQLGFDQKN